MHTVRSADATTIAFDRSGEGQPVIMVVGAFNDRSTAAPLAKLLAPRFTVYTYDRRGRGDSGDAATYSVDREVDDLDALITEAGGSAAVFGYSSGAVLSLKAAARGLAITELALYEPPYPVDEVGTRPASDLAARLAGLVAAGRRGDAVALFQAETIGIPPEVIAGIRRAPYWPALEAMAHTLVYEITITDDRALAAELGSVTVPTLVLSGAESPASMRNAARSVADAVADGRHRSLEGQTHHLVPEVLAPVLEDFLAAPGR
jgi:pimeloyl-ACP methyl ester carboxylesterase